MPFIHWSLAAAVAGLALWVPAVSAAPKEFKIDRSHSSINFEIDHFGFSRTVGRFNDYTGKVMLDEADPAKSTVELIIKTESVDTNHKVRDDHLRNADFFDAAKFPTLTFMSTQVALAADKMSGKVTGNLNLRGVTRPVTLDFKLLKDGTLPVPAFENIRIAAFVATGQIKRSEFGMTIGIPAVGDAVDLKIYVDIVDCAGEAAQSPLCKD